MPRALMGQGKGLLGCDAQIPGLGTEPSKQTLVRV